MGHERSLQPSNWRALSGEFVFVDVGSRDGFKDMALLHPMIHMYALDADPSVVVPAHRFASFRHFNLALSSAAGTMDFTVTGHAGMSSLLAFDPEAFDRFLGLKPGSAAWKKCLRAIDNRRVVATTADEWLQSQNLDHVDFLKLDTQGTELEILKGAHEYLSKGRVSIIKTEVSLQRIYREQCLFSDIDLHLRKLGYVFVDLNLPPERLGVGESTKALENVRLREELRLSHVGDAYYVRDFKMLDGPERVAKVMRAVIILNQLGYVSLAYDLLIKEGYAPAWSETLLLETATSSTLVERFKRALRRHLPPRWLRYAEKLRRTVVS